MIAKNRSKLRRELRDAVALCALVVALALAGSTSTVAATLEVLGPAGAEVLLDGTAVGTLPFAGPLEVEPGMIALECRMPGHLVHREVVRVEGPESMVSLQLELQPLSRLRAVGSSVALAGLGQLYQGRTRMGWTMVALQGSFWLLAAVAEASFQSSRDDFEVLDRRYTDAVLELEIVRLRSERAAAYDELKSAQDLRTVALGAVVAIGIWSIFDVWRAHGGFFADAEVPVHARLISDSAVTESVHWRLGWRKSF